MRRPRTAWLGEGGQSLIELAILLPVYMALFIGVFYFSLRSMNQARAAMAARAGAWYGSVGHYDKVEQHVQMFFPDTKDIHVSKSKPRVDPGSHFIGSLVNLLLANALDQNVRADATYTQPPFPWAAAATPGARFRGQDDLAFMQQAQSNQTMTAVFIARDDYWNNVNSFLNKVIGNIFHW